MVAQSPNQPNKPNVVAPVTTSKLEQQWKQRCGQCLKQQELSATIFMIWRRVQKMYLNVGDKVKKFTSLIRLYLRGLVSWHQQCVVCNVHCTTNVPEHTRSRSKSVWCSRLPYKCIFGIDPWQCIPIFRQENIFHGLELFPFHGPGMPSVACSNVVLVQPPHCVACVH